MTSRHRRPYALGREKILRKTDEFSSVFRFRQVIRGTCVEVFLHPNGLGHPRLGMVVPRRVVRLAVSRNRCRRLMREGFRLSQRELGSLDIVARVKAVCPPDRFKAEFDRLLAACHNHGTAPARVLSDDKSSQ